MEAGFTLVDALMIISAFIVFGLVRGKISHDNKS